MKKIFLLFLASCLWAGSICAQSPANRTAATVIADVLAQVPAQDKGAYTQQQEDLLSAGEEGIAQLVEMLETNDEGKAKVELALSGLTHFASAPEQSGRRLTVVNAYLSAIDRLSDAEAKAFVIRQLEVAGGDECVAKLSSLLGDESLSSPAAVALAAIRSAASGQALVDALGKPLGSRQKENVVRAIGHMQAAGAEKILKTLAADADTRLRGAVWYALSRTGSAASLPVLAAAAGQARYAPEVTGAVNAYLTLIKRLLAQGNVEEAEKAAAALWKQAKKAGEVQTCAAALQALMAAQPDKVAKYLKDALKDKNRDYRNAALEYALDYDVAALSEELAGYLKKANAECKVDIMSWFAKVFDNPDKQRQLSSAFTGVFVRQLADKDMAVKEAAAALLAKSGEEAAIRALVALLDGADERQIALARNVLSFAKGDIVPLLTPRLSTASDKGKVAILELLAMRKADGQAPAVLEQLNAPAAEVRRAAGAALKDVVALKDIPALYDLLEKSDTAAVAFVQQAIAAALKSLPSAEQLEMLVARLSKTAQAKQPLYYPVLVASGDRKALELIADRFKTATAQDKDAAFHALLGWEGIESAAELEAICRDTKASGYFDRALKRYIQLASSAGLTGENRRIFLTNALDMAGDDDQRNEILKRIGQTGSYLVMLLAGEYLDQPPLQQSAAGAVMNIALNNKSYTGKNVKRLLEKASGILDNPDASYQKEAIRKHLSEMPNEKGFAAIFNGKDLTGWKGLVGNPLGLYKTL